MKRAAAFRLVLVTAPDLKTARTLAKAALSARLVACANLVPKLESHYWWQGKLESSAEVLILFKTTRARLAALERLIVAEHPYDTPEVITLPLAEGNARYLKWLAAGVAGSETVCRGAIKTGQRCAIKSGIMRLDTGPR